jgi:hypothetical protein
MATTWIAEERVVWVSADGVRTPGRIAVAQPVEDDRCWRCEVSLEGQFSRTHRIYGEGSLQPLLLGVRFLGSMLHGFVSNGGRVLHADHDEDLDVELAALFGPLLMTPPQP